MVALNRLLVSLLLIAVVLFFLVDLSEQSGSGQEPKRRCKDRLSSCKRNKKYCQNYKLVSTMKKNCKQTTMAARLRRRGSDSEEEGELSDREVSSPPPVVKKKTGGDLWAEVIQNETLEEGMRGISAVGPTGDEVKIFDRGAESYTITRKNSNGFLRDMKQRDVRMDDQSGNSESPFVVADAAAEFGVVPSKHGARTERNLAPEEQRKVPARERNPHRNNQRNQRKWANDEPKPPENRKRRFVEQSMESLDSVGSSGSSGGHSDRPTGSRAPARSHSSASSSTHGQYGKRKKTSHFTNVVPRPDFNFERLFAARIPDDLPVVKTAEMIGEALGEVDLVPIKFAVTVVGKRVALELFAATVEQEKAGGLRVKSGFRRRTPGGVFFELLRLREDLHEAIKNQIAEFSKKHAKEKRDAEKEKQTEARIQRMHEQKEDLKPLPDAKVVMFDDLDGEEADEMAGEASGC
ncbi:Phosphorylated adapter RNA export protein [Aphelenchoides fujianensis]|nr:Phosphorylated adapter RNA export protein [Aphelenchoides fujianensis]